MIMAAVRQKTPVVLVACGSFNPITNMHLRLFEVARDALQATGRYRVVAGIVSPVSDGYNKKGLVGAQHRCEMIQLALQSSDWIRLDTWESKQLKWLETLHVLHHIRQTFNLNQCLANNSTSLANNTSLANSTSDNVGKEQKVKRRKTGQNDDVSSARLNSEDSSGVTLNGHDVEIRFLCGADVLQSFNEPGVWKQEHMNDILDKYGLVVCQRNDSTSLERLIYESDLLSKYKANIFIVTEWISNEISATKVRRAIRRGESVKYLLQDSVIDYINKNSLYSDSVEQQDNREDRWGFVEPDSPIDHLSDDGMIHPNDEPLLEKPCDVTSSELKDTSVSRPSLLPNLLSNEEILQTRGATDERFEKITHDREISIDHSTVTSTSAAHGLFTPPSFSRPSSIVTTTITSFTNSTFSPQSDISQWIENRNVNRNSKYPAAFFSRSLSNDATTPVSYGRDVVWSNRQSRLGNRLTSRVGDLNANWRSESTREGSPDRLHSVPVWADWRREAALLSNGLPHRPTARPESLRGEDLQSHTLSGSVTESQHGTSRPDTHGSRSDTHDSRPDTHGSRSDTHGSRPDTHGSRSDTHGSRPDTHGSRPDTHGSRPDTHGSRPDTHGLSKPVCLEYYMLGRPSMIVNKLYAKPTDQSPTHGSLTQSSNRYYSIDDDTSPLSVKHSPDFYNSLTKWREDSAQNDKREINESAGMRREVIVSREGSVQESGTRKRRRRAVSSVMSDIGQFVTRLRKFKLHRENN